MIYFYKLIIYYNIILYLQQCAYCIISYKVIVLEENNHEQISKVTITIVIGFFNVIDALLHIPSNNL